MGDKTKVIDTTPKDIKPLRQNTIDFLMGFNGGTAPQYGPEQNYYPPNVDITGGSVGPGGTPLYGDTSGGASGGTSLVGNNTMYGAMMPTGQDPIRPNINQQGGTSNPWNVLPMTQAPSGATGSPQDRILGATNYSNYNPNVQYAGDAGMVQAGMADMIGSPDRSSVRDVNPSNQAMMDLVMKNLNGGGLGHLNTSSVDSLGSQTSGFFNNMVNQYQPAFTQARNDAIASAKEGMGNLTGSGAGNALGTAMNRSLGQEQATLAELAKWGVGQEMQRQLGMAGVNTTRDVASLGNNLTAGVNLAEQNLRGEQSNQAADQGFIDLMAKIGIANQGEQGRALGQQGQMDLARVLQNQNLMQEVLKQSSAQGVGQSQFNATQGNAMSGQNAQNYLQLLQSMLGQNNNAVINSPGFMQSLFGAGTQIAAAYAGGK